MKLPLLRSEFDEQGFVSGIQLMADNYANVIQNGGNGQVTGIGSVKQVRPPITTTTIIITLSL